MRSMEMICLKIFLMTCKNIINTNRKALKTGVFFARFFLHKIAKSFCGLLHLHFVGNCKTSASSYSASHKSLQNVES